jgi:hypothetical protein
MFDNFIFFPPKRLRERVVRGGPTLSEQFHTIKMLYRMNVYDSNAETEGRK